MSFQDGDIVNGHRFDAASNSWVPVEPTFPGAPPPPRSVPRITSVGPCSQCDGTTGVARVPRVVDRLAGGVVLLVVAVGFLTQNLVGKNLGVIGAAAFGALIALAVVLPIAATRRYRCADCGAVQPRPGSRRAPENLSSGQLVALVGVALLGIVLLLVLANLRAHMYPDPVREKFLAGCMGDDDGTMAACQCALVATEHTYSLEEFAAVWTAIQNGGPVPEPLRTLYANC